MNFVDAVRGVGQRVEREWTLVNSSESGFAEIAHDALLDAQLQEYFNLADVVQWIGQTNTLPRQRGVRNFGEPPLTLFESRDFYIELYFWLRPNISVHDHGFTGSFVVLQGSSLQVRYCFTMEEKHGNTQTGTLDASSVESMWPGDISLIPPGIDLIHQVWHLDQPTVSLAVRTETSSQVEQQLNYFLPGLAVANTRYSESMAPKAELLTYLIRTGIEKNANLIEGLFSGQDPTGTFYSLLLLDRLAPDSSVIEKICGNIRETFGGLGQRMTVALETDQTQRVIDFSRVVDRDQRYLAALLLSALSRKQITNELSKRCGQAEVRRCVVQWLSGIVRTLGENVTEDDFVIDIVALAAQGCTFSEIQSTLTQKFNFESPEQFETYYAEVEKQAILRSVMPEG